MTERENTDRDALIAELVEALKRIAGGDYPRPVARPWRKDGKPSKNDRCPHDVWMYETCEGCLDAFVCAVLETAKASHIQKGGA